MPESFRLIYASENGDRWLLGHGEGGRVFVRHHPNEASGGVASDTELAIFLSRDRHSPQNRALRRMMGKQGAKEPSPGDPAEGA